MKAEHWRSHSLLLRRRSWWILLHDVSNRGKKEIDSNTSQIEKKSLTGMLEDIFRRLIE